MNDIKFKTIGSEDISIIQQHTDKYLPYSDFNPLSLLCWNANDDNSYAILENNLIIKIKDYLTTDVYTLFRFNNR
jgi:hypothetical protein